MKPSRVVVAVLALTASAVLARALWRSPNRPPPTGHQGPGPSLSSSLEAPPSSSASSSTEPVTIAGEAHREPVGGSPAAESFKVRGDSEPRPYVPAGAELLELEDLEGVEPGFLPSEESLYDLTLGQYLQPEFLEITQEEARKLLPLDDSIPDWPKDVRALVGGELPTRDDIARAWKDELVRQRLADVDALDIVLADLELLPAEQLTREQAAFVELLHARRTSARLELCAELERVTGYPYWGVLQRLREAWAK